MELISMTDFVLKAYDKIEDSIDSEALMFQYANFLKQPLELWMFVPCDSNDNIVEKPNLSDLNGKQYDRSIEEDMAYAKYNTLIKQGNQRVLFKGFEYKNNILKCDVYEITIMPFQKKFGGNKFYLNDLSQEKKNEKQCIIIEDLVVKYNLELSQTTINNLGLLSVIQNE